VTCEYEKKIVSSFNSLVKFLSPSQISFNSSQLTEEALYTLSYSLDGINYYPSSYYFRVYNASRFYFARIDGNVGSFTGQPTSSLMTLLGDNFFPSTVMGVTFENKALNMKFYQPCVFNTRYSINCTTPNILGTGIALPENFLVSFSPDGINYFPTNFNFTFVKSNIPVIVQVIPAFGPLNVDTRYKITVKGITAGVSTCIFEYQNSSIPNYATSSVTENNGNDIIVCEVPTDLLKRYYGVYNLRLKTLNGQESVTNFNFELFEDPESLSMTPESGQAFGDVLVNITGTGFPTNFNKFQQIKFKLGTATSNKYCTLLYNTTGDNSIYLQCTTPQYPESKLFAGEVTYISMNGNDDNFKKIGNQYTGIINNNEVLSCPSGQTASDYTQKCTLCPAGSFKPQSGFFDCIECPNNQYNPSAGGVYCESCPTYMNTLKSGSTNYYDCDCQKDSYRLNNTLPGDKKGCSPCPKGGICEGRDKIPYPQKGWWWNYNIQNNDWQFLECDDPGYCTGDVNNNTGKC
jgi:hypothetical protein